MRTIFFWGFLLLWLPLKAQKYANAFLDIGVDAASLGMAGNVTATIDNLNAAYWNPAGLMQTQGQTISFMHANYFGNMAQMHYLAYGQRDKKQAMAVSLLRFGVDNIMNTTQLIDENGEVDYDRITYFSAADYALMFSYARPLKEHWFGGATVKLLYRHIGDFASGYGFGLDAGVQYITDKWQAGLTARDITTTFSLWSFDDEKLDEIAQAVPGENQSVPQTYEIRYPSLQGGVAKKFIPKPSYTLWLEADLYAWFDRRHALISTPYVSLNPGLAVQAAYKDKVYLRAGFDRLYPYESFGQRRWHFRPSGGIGLRFKYLQLDYALNDSAASGRLSHFFSLLLDLKIFKTGK